MDSCLIGLSFSFARCKGPRDSLHNNGNILLTTELYT